MRFILFGTGATGQWAARFLLENGATPVAAYARASHVGEDLGTAVGRAPCGVAVRPVADARFERGEADIAVFCTTGRPQDLLAQARDCLLARINVVTLAEGAFYPWTYRPEIAQELHEAGVRGGATLTATGFQDGVMTHMVAALSSSVPSMTRIAVHAYNDFTHLGTSSASRMQVGSKPEDFDPNISARPGDGDGPPMSTSGQIVEALAALLGLGRPELRYSLAPVTTATDLDLPQLRVPAGRVAGLSEIVTGMTPEGIEIESRLTAKLFEPGDEDYFSCEIEGPYPSTLRLAPTFGVEGTVAQLVNRIPDVIAAEPGLQTVDRLPAPRLRRPAVYQQG